MVLDSIIAIFQGIIASYSYMGLFVVSFLSSATVFIPMPLYVLIFFSTSLGLNPLLVGLIGGIGSGLGEFSGYLVGVGGRKIFSKKIKHVSKHIKKAKELFKKYGFWAIIIIIILPLPDDVAGVVAGIIGYDIKKFLLAAIIGKILTILLIAYAGQISIPLIQQFTALIAYV